jgi:hypothetical protein
VQRFEIWNLHELREDMIEGESRQVTKFNLTFELYVTEL